MMLRAGQPEGRHKTTLKRKCDFDERLRHGDIKFENYLIDSFHLWVDDKSYHNEDNLTF